MFTAQSEIKYLETWEYTQTCSVFNKLGLKIMERVYVRLRILYYR